MLASMARAGRRVATALVEAVMLMGGGSVDGPRPVDGASKRAGADQGRTGHPCVEPIPWPRVPISAIREIRRER
jgi:hypothetical protein